MRAPDSDRLLSDIIGFIYARPLKIHREFIGLCENTGKQAHP